MNDLKNQFIKDGYENVKYDEDEFMGIVARLLKKIDNIRIHIKISKIGLAEVSVYNNSTILLKNFRDEEITFENLNKEIKELIKQFLKGSDI